MDSRMIDVAIGLVLVLALTSLAVTPLHEIWASLRKSRGETLERAVFSLLGSEGARFGQRLLAHPLIDALRDSHTLGQGKPSYIGSDVFVTALINQLCALYCANTRPETPSAFVAAIELSHGKLGAGTDEPPPALVFALKTLLDGTDADWNTYLKRVSAWYEAVGERSIGWFKRATQGRLFVFGLLLAAVVNINPFVIAPRLWNDEALRHATVAVAVRADATWRAQAPGTTEVEMLRRITAALAAPATGASAATAPATSSLQAETDARLVDLERGLIAALGTSRTDLTRLDLMEAALREVAEIRVQLKMLRAAAQDRRTADIKDAGEAIGRRSTQIAQKIAPSLADRERTTLTARQGAFTESLARESRRLTPPTGKRVAYACPFADDPHLQASCEDLNRLATQVGVLGLPIGWEPGNLPTCADGPCGIGTNGGKWELMKSCMSDINCGLMSLLGWAATALAAMLGAPFWFDMLSKLIKVRGAGAKPSADAGEGTNKSMSGTEDGSGKGLLAAPAVAPAQPVGAQPTMRDVQTVAEAGLSPARVRDLQHALQMPTAQHSGFFDGATRHAIVDWQQAQGLPPTGELTEPQIDQLLAPRDAAAAAAAQEAVEEAVDACGAHEDDPVEHDHQLPPSQGGTAP